MHHGKDSTFSGAPVTDAVIFEPVVTGKYRMMEIQRAAFYCDHARREGLKDRGSC